MFCCPVRVKNLYNGEVGQRDSSDREDCYVDCQEPSSDVDKCVCIHESATLESSRFYLPLFRFPPALMLLIATLIAIMGRESGSTAPELAAAAAAAKASLQPSGPGGPAPFVSPEQSGPDEPAAHQELFSYDGDVACEDLGKNCELLWYYKDNEGTEFGPFPETRMREWWYHKQF